MLPLVHYIDAEKNFEKQNQKISKIVKVLLLENVLFHAHRFIGMKSYWKLSIELINPKPILLFALVQQRGIVPVSNLKEKNLDIVPKDKINSETASNTLVKVFNETSPNLVKRILGRMFDTINTNSGWKKGMIVRLKGHCGVKLLHLYCRHHICERIANDVSEVVLGNSESPETDVHQQLRDNWLCLNLDEPEPFLSLPRSIFSLMQKNSLYLLFRNCVVAL